MGAKRRESLEVYGPVHLSYAAVRITDCLKQGGGQG